MAESRRPGEPGSAPAQQARAVAEPMATPVAMPVARSELVIGGQRSGKSRRGEELAAAWLAGGARRSAVMIATATAWDDEMRERIARHRRDRAERLPGMATVEEPVALAAAIRRHQSPETLLVVDCLTLWLTQLLMPAQATPAEANAQAPAAWAAGESAGTPAERAARAVDELAAAVRGCTGPVVLVSNEIGLGVIPMGREVRAFVDAQGRLNQAMAACCQRVTLMAAGLPLQLKELP